MSKNRDMQRSGGQNHVTRPQAAKPQSQPQPHFNFDDDDDSWDPADDAPEPPRRENRENKEGGKKPAAAPMFTRKLQSFFSRGFWITLILAVAAAYVGVTWWNGGFGRDASAARVSHPFGRAERDDLRMPAGPFWSRPWRECEVYPSGERRCGPWQDGPAPFR